MDFLLYMPKSKKNLVKTATIRGLEEEWVPHAQFAGNMKQLFTSEGGNINVDTLYETVKHSPEIMACILAIVEDIMADGWRFEGSKSAVENANKFQAASKFYKILTNALIDLLITGDAYILKLAVNEEQLKQLYTKLTDGLAKAFNVTLDKAGIYETLKQDAIKPKDLQLLKASTMKINFDETGEVSSFEQTIDNGTGGEKLTRVYAPKDVIHITTYNIGGKPYGFTPLEPLLSDVATLIFAKEFAGKYFENDGVPYFLFNLPEATPDDRQYELLKKELKEMKKTSNKYRTLVTTGKIDAIQINKFNKDMEYSKLITHFTQIVFMAFGVPAHRVNFTMDVKGSATELGKIESGYFKKIGFMQKAIEEIVNGDLWNDFTVELRFFKSYKIDEMREAQIAQIAAQVGFMTIEEIRERMGMEPTIPKGTMGNKTGDENNINFERDKKEERGEQPKNEIPTDNKLKTKSFNEAIEISWTNFVKVIEQRMGGPDTFDKANVLYLETLDAITMFFNDGNWKYKTSLAKVNIDVEKFMVEYLRNAVKVFM